MLNDLKHITKMTKLASEFVCWTQLTHRRPLLLDRKQVNGRLVMYNISVVHLIVMLLENLTFARENNTILQISKETNLVIWGFPNCPHSLCLNDSKYHESCTLDYGNHIPSPGWTLGLRDITQLPLRY